MEGRGDMEEWLGGYDKEFLFYSMINGEHLESKQGHNVFYFTLNFFPIVTVCQRNQG